MEHNIVVNQTYLIVLPIKKCDSCEKDNLLKWYQVKNKIKTKEFQASTLDKLYKQQLLQIMFNITSKYLSIYISIVLL